MRQKNYLVRALCLALGTTAAGGVYAQERVALEEVIVTAQKREENLQVVPLAISALSAAELDMRSIESMADLNAVAPNVMFRANPGARLISTVAIRGSVTGQPAIWIDSPVGLYLNGIYLGKTQGSVFDVVDIERIEVLRGPQGTLFGRNTEGGAINFVSRRPSGEFSGSARGELGNYDRRVGRLQVDLPKTGMASVSLGARKERADGWAKNSSGPDMGSVDNEAFRTSVLLEPSDNFTAVYDFDYSNTDQTPTPSSLAALQGWAGTFPSIFGDFLGIPIENAAAPYVATSRPDRVGTNTAPGQDGLFERSRTRAHALTLEYDLSPNDQLKYIGAYRDMSFVDSQDIDGMPLVSIDVIPGFSWGMSANYDRRTEYEQTSHELQWIAERENVNWVAGLYYFEDEGETRGSQLFTLFSLPPQQANYGADTEAWAAFGQLDWHFADQWTATVGARYTEEKRSGFSHRYLTDSFGGNFVTDVGSGLLPYIDYSETFNDTSPMAALAYELNPDINFYLRVAEGFKSGGFSSEVADPAVSTPFDPQTSLSTEVGMKSMWLDGALRLNLAVFHNAIDDLHITQLLPGTTQSLLTNAGEAVYQGFEMEFAYQINENWRIAGNYGYLDTSFDEYLDNALNIEGRPIIDTADNRLAPYAPENSLSLQLEGTLARFDFGELELLLDYTYTDEMYLYAVNKDLSAPDAGGSYVKDIDVVPDTQNLNMRLQLSDVEVGTGTMDFSFFVRNMTDEDEIMQGIDFSMFMNGAWQEPRTYTFSATYNW